MSDRELLRECMKYLRGLPDSEACAIADNIDAALSAPPLGEGETPETDAAVARILRDYRGIGEGSFGALTWHARSLERRLRKGR